MKFTKDTIRQLIAEEIENYLNEQDDSDPIDILRRLMKGPEAKAYLDKLAQARKDSPEEEFEPPTPLPPAKEREFSGSPAGIPGFEPDDDEEEQVPVAKTKIVPRSKVEVGDEIPRKSSVAATQLINPRN
tara:strand:- start:1589 stop:1978 length:390 start_codon:yes stop_codon:yes gene_type:complete